jgi:hypothetical protein
MIAKRREKILAYNSRQCTDPLFFREYYDSDKKIIPIPESELKFNRDGSPNRKQLVRIVLYMALRYSSYNPITDKYETGTGRNRSSLDIWRHIKSIYPDMDVFLIMEAIHALAIDHAEEIYGQYCSMVRRSVFNLTGPRDYMSWRCGEYKISFNTWRKLHEDPE